MLSKNREYMKLKTKYLFFFILLTLCFASYGQNYQSIPKDFIETIPPKVESEEWYKLNNSHNEFGVKISNGKLAIEKTKENNKCSLKITDGTLVGMDGGEFGGQLIFEPDDKTKSTIKINRGNVKYIFNYKDKIYFILGYAHMATSTGALYELERKNNDFTSKILIDFGDAPQAFTIYKDKFLVATFENFFIVQDFKKELVFEKIFWYALYPNSIAVVDDENVFVGIRGGIVKIDLKEKTLKFFKNTN